MRHTLTNGESVTPLLQSKQSQKNSNAWAQLLLFCALFTALCVVGLMKTSGRFEQLSEFTVGSGASELDDIAVTGPDTSQRRAPNVPAGEDEEIAVATPWTADSLGPCKGLKFGGCDTASLWNDPRNHGDLMWVVCQKYDFWSQELCAIQVTTEFEIVDIKSYEGYGDSCRLNADGKERKIRKKPVKKADGSYEKRREEDMGDSLWGELKITFGGEDILLEKDSNLQWIQPCDEFRTSYVDEMFKNLGPKQWEEMSNWMSKLDEKKSILNVKIPGTHDSGTYAASEAWDYIFKKAEAHAKATTQDMNILKSLKVGIRAVDLRIASYGIAELMCKSKIGIGHGAWGSFLCLEDVLGQIKQFLQQNPKEIVLVNIQVEGKVFVGMKLAPGLKDTAAMMSALNEIHKFAFDDEPKAAKKILWKEGEPVSSSKEMKENLPEHTLKGLRDAGTRIILITEEFEKDGQTPQTQSDLISGVIDACCETGGECSKTPGNCEADGKYTQMKQYFWEQYGWYDKKGTDRSKALKHMKKQAQNLENKSQFDTPANKQLWGKMKQTTTAGGVGREGRLFHQKYQISPSLADRMKISLWKADTSSTIGWNLKDNGAYMCETFTQPIEKNGPDLYSSMNVVWFDFVGTKMYPLWYFINLQLDTDKRISVPKKLDYTNPLKWIPESIKENVKHNSNVYVDSKDNVDTAIVKRPCKCVVNSEDNNPCGTDPNDPTKVDPNGCQRKDFGIPTSPQSNKRA